MPKDPVQVVIKTNKQISIESLYLDKIQDIFQELHPNCSLSSTFKTESLSLFLSNLGFEEVESAMKIACSNKFNPERTIKYFCGICIKRTKGIPCWSARKFRYEV